MKILIILVVITTWHCCFAPPVTKNKQEEKEAEGDGFELMMHYHRYLKEVVGALESDPEFKKKLEAADESDIRSGKIANELEFVSHHVRTRLDEIKRYELDRLRSLTRQKQILTDNEVIDDPNHGHVDHANPHTFEIEDLKKLIAKTTEDLAEADRKRKEDFKEYELQKEYEKFDKLNHTNGDEREKLEKQYQELEEKHKKHQPLHEPGHKAQLEEVWEEQDHMQQEFNPKTFFMMHDLDSNGLWDQDEVKALFVKELDKMYAAGAPEDDMRERVEEMERMRETVFHEVDNNRDGFIDFHEFLSQTKKQDFQQDNGWKGLDEQKPYTNEELEAYIRQQQMMHPPPPGYHMPPQGHYPPPQGGYHPNQVPPGAYQQGYHPNQVPQGYPQPPPQYQQQQMHHQGGNPPLNSHEVYPNQGQNYQQMGGHPPNYQGQVPNQGQVPPVHVQVPQGQGQVPQNQGQVPPVHAQVPQGHGQIPQNQGQVPPVHAQVPQGQGQVPHNQGQVPPVHAQVPQGQVPQNQGQVPVNQAQVPVNQGQVPPVEGQVPQNPQVPQETQNRGETYQNPAVKEQGQQPQAQKL